MNDCLFCKIVARELPAEVVLETETVLAFTDIHPKAPTHMLVIPKQHIATSLNEIQPADKPILGDILLAIKQLAAERGLAEPGYRTVVNTNAHAGQGVAHLHFHILGGRPLGPMVAK